MLSVYFAVLAGIASVSFGFVEIRTGDPRVITLWARFGGLIFTLVFAWLEVCCALNLRHCEAVLRSLREPYGPASVWQKGPLWVWVTWGLYSSLIIFWLVVFIRAFG